MNRSRRFLAGFTTVLGAMVFAAEQAQAVQATYWASPTGTSLTCTKPSTPCSLSQVQTVVRANNGAMTGDIVVNLQTGTYFLSSPLTLNASDSGTNGYRVIWQPDAGAAPVLSGGTQITGWTSCTAAPCSPGAGIWVASVTAGFNTRDLWVNGVRAYRAWGQPPVTLTRTTGGFSTSGSAMSTWSNPSDIELAG